MFAKALVLNGFGALDSPMRIGVLGHGYRAPTLVRIFHKQWVGTRSGVCDLDLAKLAKGVPDYAMVVGFPQGSPVLGTLR